MYFMILCKVSKIGNFCLTNLVKRGLHFQFHELRLEELSIRSYSDFIHKIGITSWALHALM